MTFIQGLCMAIGAVVLMLMTLAAICLGLLALVIKIEDITGNMEDDELYD